MIWLNRHGTVSFDQYELHFALLTLSVTQIEWGLINVHALDGVCFSFIAPLIII